MGLFVQNVTKYCHIINTLVFGLVILNFCAASSYNFCSSSLCLAWIRNELRKKKGGGWGGSVVTSHNLKSRQT